jgi:uncharacterized Zn finger protein
MLEDQIFCPTCGVDTEHALIKSGQENLVRCVDCETVHSVQIERERLVNLKVIVNKDELSTPYFIRIPAREILSVGDELLVDDASRDVVMTEITSLETDRRVNSAPAESVKTAWARATDEVPLRITVFRSGKSNSFKITVPGNEVLEVGEVRRVEGFKFSIVKIKLRGEGFADAAEAKDIVRVWGREL